MAEVKGEAEHGPGASNPTDATVNHTPLMKALTSVPSVLVLLLAMVMPAVCLVLASVWRNSGEDEVSVTGIWIRETSSLYKDTEYMGKVTRLQETSPAMTSYFFGTSRARNGDDILQAELLKDIEERLSEAQRSTKVTVDGTEFTFEDVCLNPGGAYFVPCLRFTLLDCFAEGGYDFPETAATWWQEQVLAQSVAVIRDALVNQALAMTPPAAGGCGSYCVIDGSHPDLAALSPGQPVGTWMSAAGCSGCLSAARSNPVVQAMENSIYYGAINGLKPALIALNPALEPMVASLTPADTAQWDAVVNLVIRAVMGLDGKTPYTCANVAQRGTCLPPVGGPRPTLQNATGGYLSREEVRAAVRATCYGWDEGLSLPPYNKYLYYGGVEPNIEAENYTAMRAMSSMYFFLDPPTIVERVTKNALRPGGNPNVTLAQAFEVLKQYKQAFEDAVSRGWDDDSQRMQHTAFSDDIGAGGTFRTAMEKMISNSERPQQVFFLCIPFFSAVLFIQCFRNPLVESRTALMFVGTVVVMLSFFGALGVTALVDYKLSIVHYAILPFMLVGIGVDDTYIVAMSTEGMPGDTAEERFVNAMKRVLSPVIMTSSVNFIQFMALWILCDVGAIYKVALTGFVGCGLQCLSIVTCFMPLVLLDLRRSVAGRCDVAICVKRPKREGDGGEQGNKCTFYNFAYKRLVGNAAGRVAVMLVSLALFVVACVHLGDLPVGLMLADFFPANTQAALYSELRAQYFPTWPVQMHWGEIDYLNPGVQMKMAYQWEQVLRSQYIAEGLDTTYVWTAALAEWAIPGVFDIPGGPCRPTNTLTDGNCGTGFGCESTFVENTLGLKVNAQPGDTGFCYHGATLIQSLPADHPRRSELSNTTEYCPTFQWNATHFTYCYSKWAGTDWFSIVNPGITEAADKEPRMPIRYSHANGNNLFFSIRTHNNDDYVNLLRETRKYLDDDSELHSWLSGTAYLFWEQYMDIVEFTFRAGAWSVLFGSLVSFVFLFTEFSLQGQGVPCLRRVGAALFGSVLIAALCLFAMTTVVGLCGLFEINFSVFTSASCVFSTGFTVEYTVHILHHFLGSAERAPGDLVGATMSLLAWPTFISFLTSLISMCMLLMINVQFITTYFFGPLTISILVTYLFGAFLLPSLLGTCRCLPTLHAKVEKDAGSDVFDI